ncbi:MAG: SDR family oxidoreductase [Nocardioidaceae bacterium]|nr:SDR family oxidoreductase [Nocardioidaceae bacterium]
MSDPASRLVDRYGPWAVVTGASDGIGRAFAGQLAASGLSVVLVARRREVLQALATELERRHRVATEVVAADLATRAGREAVEDATRGVDVGLLVASAGFGTSGPFLAGDLDVELGMIDVNCGALLAQSHHFAERFAERGRGGLVLLSSLVAFQGVPRAANYAATKAYVQTLAEALRVELKPHGVDVLACAPGPVDSAFATRAHMQMGATVTPETVAEGALAALGRRTTVAPGALSKLLTSSLRTLPRAGRVRVMQKVMAGMTPAAASGPTVADASPSAPTSR